METLFIFCWLGCSFIYGGFAEWALHKHVLHGLGKNKKSLFSFHWHEHHKSCRHNKNIDTDYARIPLPASIKKELASLFLLIFAHIIFLFIQFYFFIGLVIYVIRYFYIHRRAHLDVEWCKKNIPWHYDHHMGKNQDANYGVTVEWPDKLFGTRIAYLGVEKHEEF